MLKKYIAYLKDNPEGYWFKRKLYGWGWTPVRWQGWVTLAVYVFVVFMFVLNADLSLPKGEVRRSVIIPIIMATVILLVVCYEKGESPRWQWGIPRKK